ncbi:hypothetical protein, partial [Brevibacillus sp. NL20B1]|uniref:hypothetical protein n=1 Tax=Brevibacillus sp. NL20B1 TaxID=2829799 RepID=UPI001BADF5B8
MIRKRAGFLIDFQIDKQLMTLIFFLNLKILEFGEQVTYVRWSAVRHSKMRCLVPSYQISAELNNKKRLNESVKMKGIAMMGVRMKKTTKANT